MLLRRINVQQAVKSLVQNREGFAAAAVNAKRFISTSEGVNSDFVTKKEPKISPSELDQRQKLKKTIRTLSTLNHSVPLAARASVSKDESREFMAVFPDLVRDLTEAISKYDPKFAAKWYAKALQYNVPRGKKNRGLATVLTYKQLVDKSELTPENVRLAQYVGWCVEMLQAMFLVFDDVMDGSTTRRGQPCWHRMDGVGLIAINDALMIENGIYHILKKYFSHTEYYTKLVDLFREVTLITTTGQSLDAQMANKDPTHFTMEKYKTIVANKTSYYTFYLPVAAPMHMCGFTDPEVFRQAKTILLEMGHFFQIQDDFLDCFGDPAITGKVGTDIQENKCSWLAIVCMQRASDEQKAIMKECYGQKDPAKVARVKELYKELGIPNTYAVYEEESYNMIKTHIQQTSRGVPHQIFLKILDKIYQRDS
ncbi:unnamed protein product [Hermetia illucens]|uniref:Farnesyl pyrophosphate synthase n=1 Tax=Hermetia illucens TaxID=343691 RepID=A0A7R8YLB0_HERIL|nr:farnesyl pyrophosphate synthase-like [Hermetia illucens]CAD7077313.1 unnamed protein product [Hermetia illucens]